MEIVEKKPLPIKSWCMLAGLMLFFLGMLTVYGVGIYNDSVQYIEMHVHREPLYPLFLAFFRGLCGDGYLSVAAAAQGILTALGIWMLTRFFAARFALRLWEEALLLLLQLAPHLVTRYVSAIHIFVENSVMSEALCFPLFSFFLYFLLRMLLEERRRYAVLALVFAYLLSMTRGQLMTTILLWALLLGIKQIAKKKYRSLFIVTAAVCLTFVLRSLTVHVYNYAVTGHFLGNTFGKVNTLTNVIYACDEEDGEVFAGESPEDKKFLEYFNMFYEKAQEQGLTYKAAGDGFSERAAYLEEHHDDLKFEVLEAGFSAHYFGQIGGDYYEMSRWSDEMAEKMIKNLLPACFGQWLYDYILLCRNGFVRSIAVVHPFITPAAFLLYLAAAGLAFKQIRKKRNSEAAVVCGVALLFIAANVCATSLTIMCLSRYMIYGFSIFYSALFLLVREEVLAFQSRK